MLRVTNISESKITHLLFSMSAYCQLQQLPEVNLSQSGLFTKLKSSPTMNAIFACVDRDEKKAWKKKVINIQNSAQAFSFHLQSGQYMLPGCWRCQAAEMLVCEEQHMQQLSFMHSVYSGYLRILQTRIINVRMHFNYQCVLSGAQSGNMFHIHTSSHHHVDTNSTWLNYSLSIWLCVIKLINVM